MEETILNSKVENKAQTNFFTKLNSAMNKFFNSDLFILFYSLLVLVSWAVECEYIAVIGSVIILIYMFLTQQTLDRIVVVACIIPAMVDNNMRYRISFSQLYILGALLLLVIASAVWFFIKNKQAGIKGRSLAKSSLLVGYASVVLVGLFAGLLYSNQTLTKVLMQTGCALLLLGLYVLIYKTTNEETKYTIIKSIIALCFVIVAEMLIYFIRVDDLKLALVQKSMSLGWAITNSVACVLAIGIPMCFYMAYKSKFQLGYLLSATLFLGFIFLTNCRSMLVIGTVVYIVCTIIALFKLNKWQVAVNLAVAIGLALVFYFVIFNIVFSQFQKYGLDGNGREELYKYYWQKFKEEWVFGMGFFTDTAYQADGMVRVHNTVLQILASAGIFGVICFIPYYYQRYRTLLIKPNMFKLFAVLSYLAYAGYGMVDCALISSYKLIVIYLLLYATELDSIEQTKKEEQLIADGKLDPMTLSHPYYRNFFKRLFDIICSALALIILSPIMLVTAILVRIKLGRPVIFKQLRVGKNGKLYNFIKFRSMSNKRDENGALLPDYMRLGKFGSFLRKTSIDELPQLWLVFIGKMSLIGPRPRDIKECVFLNKDQDQRHLVLPGITGWAQVHGRNSINFDKVCEYDRYYVKNCSLWLDIKTIFLTIKTVFRKKDIDGEVKTANNMSEYYGDYLLRIGQISKDEYDRKINSANEMIQMRSSS